MTHNVLNSSQHTVFTDVLKRVMTREGEEQTKRSSHIQVHLLLELRQMQMYGIFMLLTDAGSLYNSSKLMWLLVNLIEIQALLTRCE